MQKDLNIEGEKYISAKKASELFGYTSDYIGQLSRANLIKSTIIGKTKFVEEKGLSKYIETAKNNKLLHKNGNGNGNGNREITPVKYPPDFTGQAKSQEYENKINYSIDELPLLPTLNKKSFFDINTKKDETFLMSPFLSREHFANDIFFKKFVSVCFAIVVVFGPYALLKTEYAEAGLREIKSFAKDTYELGKEITQKINKDGVIILMTDSIAYTKNLLKDETKKIVIDTASTILATGVKTTEFSIKDVAKKIYLSINSIFGKEKVIGETRLVKVPTISKPAEVKSSEKTTNPITIIQTQPTKTIVIEGPTKVVERFIERTSTVEITKEELETRLQQLDNKLTSKIYNVSSGTPNSVQTVYNVVSQTNKIDKLGSGVEIVSPAITGGTIKNSIITDSSFSGTTINGSELNISGDATIEGQLTISGVATSTIAGDINFDSDTLFIDSLNNRIGLGTTTPQYTLDVVGDINTSGSIISLGNSFFGNATTTDITYFNSRIGTSLVPTVDNVLNLGDETNWLRWKSALFGTSIGIGGTSTSTGSSLLSSGIYTIDSTNGILFNTTNNASTTFGTGLVTAPNFFGTNATITNATTTNFFASVFNAITSVFSSLTSGTATIGSLTATSSATLSYTGADMLITTDSTGKLVSSSTPQVASITATSTTATSTFAGGLTAGTNNALTVESGASANSLYVKTNGNVGIGTASPNYNLSLYTATNPTFQIINSATGSTINDGLTLQMSGVDGYITNRESGKLYLGTNSQTQLVTISNTTGNVGLSNTNPTYKIDVTGPELDVNNFLRLATALGSVLTVVQSSNPQTDLSMFDTNTATKKVNISTSGNTYLNGGNVGIGTTTPYSKLSVWGSDALAHSALEVTNSASTTLMTVLNSGNVGIGTTAPGAKLEVNGNMILGSGSGGYKLYGVGTAYSYIEPYNASTGDMNFFNTYTGGTGGFNFYTNNNATAKVRIDTSGNVGIGTTSPQAKLDIRSSAVDSWVSRNVAFDGSILGGFYESSIGDARFYMYNAAETNNIFLTTNGSSYLNGGNVGIGTTAPVARLDVWDSNDYGLRLTSSAAPSYYTKYGLTGFDVYGGSQVINFKIAGSEKVRIDNTGNVGIGTTGPLGRLDVRSTNVLLDSNAGQGFFGTLDTSQLAGRGGQIGLGGYLAGVSNQYPAAVIKGSFHTDTTGYLGDLIFGTMQADSAIVERMRIDGSGNVGIGTTSPGAKLQVEGTIQTYNNLHFYSSNNTRVLWKQETGPADANLYFKYNDGASDSTKVTILGSGNVGIGTTAPATTLQVSNALGSSLVQAAFTDTSGTPSTFYIGAKWLNGWPTIGTNDATRFSIAANNATRMTFDTTGNVGIGTTAPGAKLDVNGNVFSRGVLFGYAGAGNQYGGLSWDSTDDGYLFLKSANTQTVKISANGNSYLNGGNVGIGTTSPYSKLSVWGSGTTGELANFTNSASTTVMSILNSGNVGIGTTSPASKLDVADTNPILTLTANAGGFSRTSKIDFGATFSATDNSARNAGNISGGLSSTTWDSSYLNFQTRNVAGTLVDAMRITNGGNVGIGTTAPGAKLEVAGSGLFSAAAAPSLTVRGTSSGSADIYVDTATNYGGFGYKSSGTEQWFIGNNATGSNDIAFMLGASRTVGMFINQDGNVGIGTTAPDEKLTLSSTGATNIKVVSADTNASTYYMFSGADYWRMRHNADNVFDISYNGTQTTGLAIATSGSVGIGTTAPGAKLDVWTSTNARVQATATGANNPTLSFIDSGGATQYGTIKTYDLLINNGSTDLVKITNAGNLGIQTASPTSNFQVSQSTTGVGTVSNLAGGTTVTGVGTQFTNTFKVGDTITIGGQTVAISAIASDTSMTTAAITAANTNVAYTLVGGDRFVVKGNGNVGIGTTTPDLKLTVIKGGQSPTGLSVDQWVGSFINNGSAGLISRVGIYSGSAGQALLNFGAAADADIGGISYDNTDNSMAFRTNNAEWARITSAGNVGIGTTAPGDKLDVNGNVIVRDDIVIWGAAAAQRGYISSDASHNMEITGGYNDNGGIELQTITGGVWTPRLAIVNSGNVGIGTTSPASKLDVADTNPILTLTANAGGFSRTSKIDFGATFSATDNSARNAGNISGGLSSTTWDSSYLNFQTRNVAGTLVDAMRITNGGNVGIGTTSPYSKLSVWGSGTTGELANFTNSASTTVMSILNSGNVGIGTTAPGVSLDVNGDVRLSGINRSLAIGYGGTTPANRSSLQVINYDNGAQYDATLGGTYNASNQREIYLSTDADTQNFRIDTSASNANLVMLTGSGNVGIGTTSPYSKLSVWGSGTTGELANFTNSASTTVMSILNSGNVGIGTTVPTAKLELGASGLIKFNSVGANTATIGYDGSSRFTIDGSNTNGYSSLLGTWYMNGNVGIGTTTPYSTLSVASGNASAFNGAICADNGGLVKCYGTLTAGTVYGDTSSFSATDLAENYSVTEIDLEAGDIVAVADNFTAEENNKRTRDKEKLNNMYKGDVPQSIADSLNIAVKKATNRENIMGIISSKPGVLLGDATGTNLETILKPVALSGRVPVKVNNEGGTIKKGDKITLSSVSGVGTKATTTTPIVGIALEDFDGVSGKITVFVNLNSSDVQDNSALLASMDLKIKTLEEIMGISSTSGSVVDSPAPFLATEIIQIISDWFSSLGVKIYSGLVEFKNVIADTFTVGSSAKPSGITMYDEDTGEPYCLKIKNGVMVSTAGECQAINTQASQTATVISSTTGDIEPPVITLIGSNPAQIEKGTSFVDPGATVTDNVTQGIIPDMVENTVNTSITGEYQVVWTAHDSALNYATTTRTVIVTDPYASATATTTLDTATTTTTTTQ